LMIEHKDYSVPKGKFLEVSGPAALRVLKGTGILMGKRLCNEDFIIVPRWRTYVIRAEEDMRVSISQSQDTEVKIVDYNVSLEWEEKLRKLDADRIVVAGPVDAGKSSVTATLANIMLENKGKIVVINSDVGQSNFCLPTTVCKAEVKDFIFTLHDLKPVRTKFTGTITPAVEGERVIASTAALVEDDFILDTDGWVDGYEAGYYKHNLLEAVRPQAVIYLGEPPWWTKGPWKLVKLTPTKGRSRSRGDRRTIRKEKYKKALEKCDVREINLEGTTTLFSRLFTSRVVDRVILEATAKTIGTKPLMVAMSDSKVIAVVRRGARYRKVREVTVIEEGEERGLLVGLGDENGNDTLGMIIKIDYKSLNARIKTCFEGVPSYLSFGRVKLDENWNDAVCNKFF